MILARLAVLTAFALPAAAIAAPATPAPASAPINMPGVSPAGQAVLAKLLRQPVAGSGEIVQQQRANRDEMIAAISAPTINVDTIAAILKRREALQMRIMALGDTRLVETLKALPAADRGPFLRAVMASNQQRAAAAAGR